MDPLSIVASLFGLAGGIAKASVALIEYSRDFKDCKEDLDKVSKEVQALAGILEPLTRTLSRTQSNPLFKALVPQVDSTITGCSSVINQLLANLQKYQRDRVMTKAKWAIFGREETEKLRGSLEVYKMALSLGLHAVSITVGQDIKDDTEILRVDIAAMKITTNEVLARVNSIRATGGLASRHNQMIQQWVDDISMMSTYAESLYQGSIVDPNETATTHYEQPNLSSMDDVFDVEVMSDDGISSSRSSESTDRGTSFDQGTGGHTSSPAQAAPTDIGAMINLESPPRHQATEQPAANSRLTKWIHSRRERSEKTYNSLPPVRPRIPRRRMEDIFPRKGSAESDSDSTSLRYTARDRNNGYASLPSRISRQMREDVSARRGSTGEADSDSTGWGEKASTPRVRPRTPPPLFISCDEWVGGEDTTGHFQAANGTRRRMAIQGLDDVPTSTRALVSQLRRDEDLIQTSKRRRAELTLRRQRELQDLLNETTLATPPAQVRDLVAEGADPSFRLQFAIETFQHAYLVTLLECGAEPNLVWHSARSGDCVPMNALAHAAGQGNETATWALAIAGAMMNSPTCYRSYQDEHFQSGATKTEIHLCQPLPLIVTAFRLHDDMIQAELETQARIIRFLAQNGTDVNSRRDIKHHGQHVLMSPLTTFAIFNRGKYGASHRVAELLIEAGAKFQSRPVLGDSNQPDQKTPNHEAGPLGVPDFSVLLGRKLDGTEAPCWKRAIFYAACNQHWDTIEVLLKEPFVQDDYLHYLVNDYMRQDSRVLAKHGGLGIDNFSTAVEMLILNGEDPQRVVTFQYERRNPVLAWMLIDMVVIVKEPISVLTLVDRIYSSNSRNEVRKVIKKALAAAGRL